MSERHQRTRIDVRTHPASTDLSVGSLFAGIGGLELGLKRAGMDVVWQVEIDPFCRSVLARHWPDVPRYGDVTELDFEELEPVDVICGGFPCQPVSRAGRRRAQRDERWLWPWFADAIGTLRPRYVLVENVPGLLAAARGSAFGEVLGDLATLGYDAEWDCIPAAAVGAPHLRDRTFLIAWPQQHGALADSGGGRGSHDGLRAGRNESRGGSETMADPVGVTRGSRRAGDTSEGPRRRNANRGGVSQDSVADPDSSGLEGRRLDWIGARQRALGPSGQPDPGPWSTEPDVGRVAHGIPNRVDRLRALGNAVVPQVAEHVGRLIVADADRMEVAA